jgi:adenylate cyclase
VLEELEAAGVLDPARPNAESQRAIAQYLLDAGLTIDDVVAIFGSEDLGQEMTTRLLFPGPRVRIDEFAERVGMSVEQIEHIRMAAGLPYVDDRKMLRPVFSTNDEKTFAVLKVGIEMFGEPAVLQFLRVAGSALSQIAEAAVAIFAAQIAGPLEEQHAPDDVQLKAEIDATQTLAAAGGGLDTLFRFHAATAIRRLSRAQEGASSYMSARLAVGFVDLVGFTPLAAALDARQLNELFDVFEARASEVITTHDARLVKLIGDAVMFTAPDADSACEIALTLVEDFADDTSPVTPRGALALGEMLIRAGDYYGPVVNLAARAADLAVPYEVLVSEEVAATAGPAFRFEPAGRRLLKGFTEPLPLATLLRAH